MANPSIRGHQGQFKIFENGALARIVGITKVDVNQKSSFMQTMYVGRKIPEGDQSIEGWEGTIDCEVKDPSVDDFIDALVTDNLNGIGVSDYAFVTTEFYNDGTSRSYVHTDCQFKMSKSQGGLGEKMTKRLDFQAATRTRI